MIADFQIPETKEQVLNCYNFAVVHLRQQYRFKRIGLTLGAGVSVPLKYPSWDQLVERISSHSAFPRNFLQNLPTATLSTNTQRIFEFFHACLPREESETPRLYQERVANRWKRILAECLYKNNRGNQKDKSIQEHPYLASMLEVIAKSNITLNFNFDDSIEHALDLRNSLHRGKSGKSYETRWDLTSPIRNDIPTIFHPNGFIPHREHEYLFRQCRFRRRLVFEADDARTHGRRFRS